MQRSFKERRCVFNTTYHLSLSRFNEEKEIRIVCSKMAQKSNAKCCGNVLITSESEVVTTSETDVGTTHFRPCHNHFRSCHNVAVPAGENLQNLHFRLLLTKVNNF